jgi:hypothetical protein
MQASHIKLVTDIHTTYSSQITEMQSATALKLKDLEHGHRKLVTELQASFASKLEAMQANHT